MPFQGYRLKSIRERRGYTQSELADRIGMGQRQLSRYEGGKNDPSGDVIARFAAALDVTADYLLGLTDEPGDNLKDIDLTVVEWKIIKALRAGMTIEVLQTVVDLTRAQSRQQNVDEPG